MSTAYMRRIHNWTHRGGESSELATHHLSLFKRRWGTFNTFPPDHRKTTVNITKRKKVKWWRKHVDQPPVMRKIPQQVIGASLEEMVQRVLSRPEIILQRWLNKTSEKEDSNRIRCSHQGWWTTKIKLETCSSETTDGMQRRWNKSAVLRATTKSELMQLYEGKFKDCSHWKRMQLVQLLKKVHPNSEMK